MFRKLNPVLQLIIYFVLSLAAILLLELIITKVKGKPFDIRWGRDLSGAGFTALLTYFAPQMNQRVKK